MDLLNLLSAKGLISKDDAAKIKKELAPGASVTSALLRRGLSKEAILKVVSEETHVPPKILSGSISNDVLGYIPEESARHYEFIPLSITDDILEVGILDPDNIEAIDALNFISSKINLPYQLFVILDDDFAKVIEQYKNLSGEVGEALSELETSIQAQEGDTGDAKKEKGQEIIKEDAPVTKIVATILRYAVEGGASDIHIEPTANKVRVRFRMDGQLHTSLELPEKVQRAVVARIKILSQMRLDERRKPQDGRFSATVEKRPIDFRVSTFPTYYGEKIVMRILDRSKKDVTLESVGLNPTLLKLVRASIKKPYGIVLITGPTGSGKSTTLYAMLSEVDREIHNVVSLEDPIEYDVEGVAQSQVRPEIGYTFASGLRSILRQDPNIIMLGEIRDKETAQLAVQASLTGHLVLSTLHTNTASGAIPRLIDMGVDPYLIAPTLIAVIGQRLVRVLCPGGGKQIPIVDSLQVMLEKQFADLPASARKDLPKWEKFMGVAPSPDCPNGTRGRTGVFEVLEIDKDIEKILLTNPTEEAIYETARTKGMLTMKEDAIIKALHGEIPFEEVNSLGGDLVLEEQSYE
jgi:type IV pilus assembly protein PilB